MAGWIRRAHSGRYQARYRTPGGRTRSETFDRRKDAEKWLRRELALIDRGDWIDPDAGTMTVAEWADRWMATRLHIRDSTRERDETYLRSLILPHFGTRRLRDITRHHIQNWTAELAEEGYAAATIRRSRSGGRDRPSPNDGTRRIPLRRSCLWIGEYVVQRDLEDSGDLEGNLEGWRVFSQLDRVHCLTRQTDGICEFGLGHLTGLEPEPPNLVSDLGRFDHGQTPRRYSTILVTSEASWPSTRPARMALAIQKCATSIIASPRATTAPALRTNPPTYSP